MWLVTGLDSHRKQEEHSKGASGNDKQTLRDALSSEELLEVTGKVQLPLLRIQPLARPFLSDNDPDPQPVGREAPLWSGVVYMDHDEPMDLAPLWPLLGPGLLP